MNTLLATVVRMRHSARSIVIAVAVLIVILELGGIWNEVHQMRSEQVKNALYSLPANRRKAIKGTGRGNELENSVTVKGSVEIEGDVHVDEPLEVEVVQ